MFIIDLDDTLLDTQGFKEARTQALKDIGVSEEIYNKSYQEAYTNSLGINTYNDTAHAEVLQKYGFDKQLILETIGNITANLKIFLFPDAIDFLQFLKEKKQKLIL